MAKKIILAIAIVISLLALSLATYVDDLEGIKEAETQAEATYEQGNFTYSYDDTNQAHIWVYKPTGSIFVIKES